MVRDIVHELRISAAVLAGWLIAGVYVVPELIVVAYDSGLLPTVSTRPLAFYLAEWQGIVWYGAAAGLAVALFLHAVRSPAYAERFVPDARPSDLGAIRIVAGGVLLVSALWEDLSSTAVLPREMMNPLGVMSLLAAIPGYEWFSGSAAALRFFEWATALVLLCATVGFKTRLAVPVGALMYLVLGGLLRQYAWFYHTGLIPLYVLAVLSFLPAEHGLSLDRWLGKRRGRLPAPDVPSRRYGWARYAVWAAVAIPYVAAGFSKLRNGGLDWWEASNFKFILFHSTLRPMEFDFEVSLALVSAPDWVFEALALSAVAGEILYGLNLVSRRARQIMPMVMLLMHVGILFLQNILFFDLIVLQLIFLDFRPLLRRLRTGHRPAVEAPARGSALGQNFGPLEMPRRSVIGARGRPLIAFDSGRRVAASEPGRRVTATVVVLLAFCWVFRIEFYPLTGMQMFSTIRGEPVTYEIALAHTRAGETVRAPIERSIRAMSDARFRRVLEQAFDPAGESTAYALLQAVADRWNAVADGVEQIDSFEIQRWEWFYLAEPDHPMHGDLVASVVYPVNVSSAGDDLPVAEGDPPAMGDD